MLKLRSSEHSQAIIAGTLSRRPGWPHRDLRDHRLEAKRKRTANRPEMAGSRFL